MQINNSNSSVTKQNISTNKNINLDSGELLYRLELTAENFWKRIFFPRPLETE